jgi:hypothetical protein
VRLVPLALTLVFNLAYADDGRTKTVSYDNDVLPLLNTYCVMCHLPGSEQGGLGLYPDAWSQIVGISSKQSPLLLVTPGFPDQSYFYIKLIDSGQSVGGSGLLMPFQQPPLNPDQIETIQLWIKQGAERN